MHHGWEYGRGRGWHYRRWWQWRPVSTPEGWVYLGPCRCGWGPHAYWQTPEGKIVSSWAATPLTPEEEIEALKAYESSLKEELEEIRKRIESLKRMKEEPPE